MCWIVGCMTHSLRRSFLCNDWRFFLWSCSIRIICSSWFHLPNEVLLMRQRNQSSRKLKENISYMHEYLTKSLLCRIRTMIMIARVSFSSRNLSYDASHKEIQYFALPIFSSPIIIHDISHTLVII